MKEREKKRTRLGLHALRSKIQLRGLNSVDRRMVAARELLDWKQEVTDALGGSENISAMKAAVIEEAVRVRAYLNHIDAFLLGLDSVIDRRSKKLRSIIGERMRIGEHLMRQMDRLGLERQAKPLPSLQEYLAKSDESEIEKEQPSEDNSSNDGR